MRLSYLLSFILVLSGVTLAQQTDTSFPVGPQYLITQPSAEFLQPIQTPSMEPWQPSGVVSPQSGEAESVMMNVPAYLPGIYWGTPAPGAEVVPEPVPVPSRLPPDYIDVGVSAIATPGWQHEHDSGMTLAQAARYWKAHKLHAARVYTNQDIDRLHGE